MHPAHHLARAKRLLTHPGKPGDETIDIEIEQIDRFIHHFLQCKRPARAVRGASPRSGRNGPQAWTA